MMSRLYLSVSFSLSLCISLLTLSAPSAMVGDWKSFTNMTSVTSLLEHKGHLYVGTVGGVRILRLSDMSERTYGREDGLMDVHIAGFAVDGRGDIWAAGRSGYVQRFTGSRWESHGKGYAAGGWTVHPGAFAARGNYLVLGSAKGLSFFDIRNKMAAASLDKFAFVTSAVVHGLLLRGDSLYVVANNAVLAAEPDWQELTESSRTNIFDRGIWDTVPVHREWLEIDSSQHIVEPDSNDSTDSVDTTGTVIYDIPDSTRDASELRTLAVKRDSLFGYGEGALIPSPLYVRAVLNRPLQVGQRLFFHKPMMRAAAVAGNRVFVGSLEGLFEVKNGNLAPLSPKMSLPVGEALNIDADGGRVAARINSTRLQYPDWNVFYTLWNGLAEFVGDAWRKVPGSSLRLSSELADREQKTLSVVGDGYVIGHWGDGLILNSEGKQFGFTSENSPIRYVEPPDYTVIYALSEEHDGGVFLANFDSGGTNYHQLCHLQVSSRDVHCYDAKGAGERPHDMTVIGDTVLAVSATFPNGGLTLYKIHAGGNHPSLTLEKTLTTDIENVGAWAANVDVHGRIWVLLDDGLGYVGVPNFEDAGDEERIITKSDFPGQLCHSMTRDGKGRLWFGCSDGVYELQTSSDPETVRYRRYHLDDGLLSNYVYDLSADPHTGALWVATDRGISRFQAGGETPRPSLSGVRVYPNPFKQKHRVVVFDRLTNDASVSIFTSGGEMVRHFSPDQMKGSEYQWDGTNAAGRTVQPGVYLYSVHDRKSKVKGKLIVAR